MLLKIGDWNVAPSLNRLERNGDSVKLEPRVMELLVYLASTRGRVVPADELLREVWKGRVFDDGIVYKNINHLRKALKDDLQHPRFIETIPKRGYCLVATVEHVVEERQDIARKSSRWLVPIAGPVIAIAGIVLWLAWRDGDAPASLGNASASTPLTSDSGDEIEPSWSPDGARVVFVSRTASEGSRLKIVQLGTTLDLTKATPERVRTPRWSPKGGNIAFLRQRDITNFDLVVVSELGGSERKVASVSMPLLAVFDAMPFITWTPDGSGLVFTTAAPSSNTGPAYALQRVSLDTGASQPIGLVGDSNEYDTAPAFSADGRRLAFVRYRFNERLPRLMVQRLGSDLQPEGVPEAVQDLPAGVPRCPVWVDRETLAFSLGLRVLEWRAGAGASVRYTLPPALTGGLDIVWRDGRARLVVSLAKGNLDLWSLPIDPATHRAVGPPKARVHSMAVERHPSFSNDGRLAYTSSSTGHEELYVSGANGTAPLRLSELKTGILSNPRWSPDNRQLAFFAVMPPEGKFVVHVVDVAGGLPKQIFNGGVSESWSGDGQYVYVGRPGTQTTTVRVRVADGHQEELFAGGSAVETVDGKDLLYSKRGEWGIFARSLEGFPGSNPERSLVSDYTPARAAIVPTKGGFYYLSHTADAEPRAFSFFDYESQKAHDVAPAPARVDVGMTLSPSGDELVYSAPAPGDDFDLAVLDFESH